jgi:phage replication O-like protein O
MNCTNPLQLSRILIDAALSASLSQNELKVFLVLLRQTLTFSKTADALTAKRIATLSHIRKDRVLPALQGLLHTQLFTTEPHPLYETKYSIHEQYLNTPSLPQNRKSTPCSEPISEKRVHTLQTFTRLNPNTTTAPPSTRPKTCSRDEVMSTFKPVKALPYPQTFTANDQHQAAQVLDGLSPKLASDCLQVLDQALQTGKVLKPLAYLYQLVKAARNGILDTSTLPKTDERSTPLPPSNTAQIRQLQAEIYSLDQLFQRSKLPMDSYSLKRRSALIEELHHQQATIPPTPPMEIN